MFKSNRNIVLALAKERMFEALAAFHALTDSVANTGFIRKKNHTWKTYKDINWQERLYYFNTHKVTPYQFTESLSCTRADSQVTLTMWMRQDGYFLSFFIF